MKCLITGINGLVGQNLRRELAQEYKWSVYGIGTSESKSLNYLQIDLSKKLKENDLALIPEDLECIVHCAALTDKSASPFDLSVVNIGGSVNALEIAKKKKVKLFINISGITVIGSILEKPITENHPCTPTSFYVQTKLCAEHTLNCLTDFTTRTVHLRIPSPVGLNMPPKTILPIFLKKALENQEITLVGDKRRKQNFLDLRDLAEAIVQISKLSTVHGTYNIAAEQSVSNEDLAIAIISKLQSRSTIIDNSSFDLHSEVEDWRISTKKAFEEFGFKSKFSLNDTLDWLIKNR